MIGRDIFSVQKPFEISSSRVRSVELCKRWGKKKNMLAQTANGLILSESMRKYQLKLYLLKLIISVIPGKCDGHKFNILSESLFTPNVWAS